MARKFFIPGESTPKLAPLADAQEELDEEDEAKSIAELLNKEYFTLDNIVYDLEAFATAAHKEVDHLTFDAVKKNDRIAIMSDAGAMAVCACGRRATLALYLIMAGKAFGFENEAKYRYQALEELKRRYHLAKEKKVTVVKDPDDRILGDKEILERAEKMRREDGEFWKRYEQKSGLQSQKEIADKFSKIDLDRKKVLQKYDRKKAGKSEYERFDRHYMNDCAAVYRDLSNFAKQLWPGATFRDLTTSNIQKLKIMCADGYPSGGANYLRLASGVFSKQYKRRFTGGDALYDLKIRAAKHEFDMKAARGVVENEY